MPSKPTELVNLGLLDKDHAAVALFCHKLAEHGGFPPVADKFLVPAVAVALAIGRTVQQLIDALPPLTGVPSAEAAALREGRKFALRANLVFFAQAAIQVLCSDGPGSSIIKHPLTLSRKASASAAPNVTDRTKYFDLLQHAHAASGASIPQETAAQQRPNAKKEVQALYFSTVDRTDSPEQIREKVLEAVQARLGALRVQEGGEQPAAAGQGAAAAAAVPSPPPPAAAVPGQGAAAAAAAAGPLALTPLAAATGPLAFPEWDSHNATCFGVKQLDIELKRDIVRQQVQRLSELKAALGLNSSEGCLGPKEGTNSSDPCNWDRVSCDGHGLVVVLSLSGCNIQGTLPASLGNESGLGYLQVLDLSGNPGLRGKLPPEWGTGRYLASLRVLRLGGARLAGPVPSEWCSGAGLAAIEILSMDHVQALDSCCSVAPGSRAGPGLAKLKQLQLSSGSPPEATATKPMSQGSSRLLPGLRGCARNLQQLYVTLDNPSRRVTLPPEWAGNDTGLSALTTLSITGPGLVGSLPPEWGTGTGLSALTEISITNTSLEGTLPATWPTQLGSNFLHINLEGNAGLGGSLPSEWDNFGGRLHQLRLKGTAVAGTIPCSWSQLTVLGPGYFTNSNLKEPKGCITSPGGVGLNASNHAAAGGAAIDSRGGASGMQGAETPEAEQSCASACNCPTKESCSAQSKCCWAAALGGARCVVASSIDYKSDPYNCGTCGNVCNTPALYGKVCINGTCQCGGVGQPCCSTDDGPLGYGLYYSTCNWWSGLESGCPGAAVGCDRSTCTCKCASQNTLGLDSDPLGEPIRRDGPQCPDLFWHPDPDDMALEVSPDDLE